mgnify:CR=1 FL=1
MLLTVAAFRTPIIALMPDLVPSALRSKANGVINLMGGLVALAAVGVLLWQVKEPRGLVASAAEGDEGLGIFAAIRNIPRENARSLTLLILAMSQCSLAPDIAALIPETFDRTPEMIISAKRIASSEAASMSGMLRSVRPVSSSL